MKRIVVGFLILTLVLTMFTGCGRKTSISPTGTPEKTNDLVSAVISEPAENEEDETGSAANVEDSQPVDSSGQTNAPTGETESENKTEENPGNDDSEVEEENDDGFRVEFPGKAIRLDGSDDYVSFTELWETTPDALTIEAWVYVNSPGGSIFYHGFGNNTGNYAIELSVNAVHLYENDTQGILAVRPEPPAFGQWYHIAAVWEKTGVLQLYINAELVAVGSSGPGFNAPDWGPSLGSMNRRTAFLDGMLDEVRVWNMARTAEDIRKTMYTSLTGDEQGLAAYWAFDEAEGLIVTDLAGSHDGTLENAVEDARVISTVPLS